MVRFVLLVLRLGIALIDVRDLTNVSMVWMSSYVATHSLFRSRLYPEAEGRSRTVRFR